MLVIDFFFNNDGSNLYSLIVTDALISHALFFSACYIYTHKQQ